MSETKVNSIMEIINDALEHYSRISSQAGEWNSIIPTALEFYRVMHTSSMHNIDHYYDDEFNRYTFDVLENVVWIFCLDSRLIDEKALNSKWGQSKIRIAVYSLRNLIYVRYRKC